MSHPLEVVNQPVCRHLLSKGMFVSGQMNPEADDPEVGDGYCWCNRTAHMLGPDSQLASRQRCLPGRDCFEARF